MKHKITTLVLCSIGILSVATVSFAGYRSSQSDSPSFSVNLPNLNINASFNQPAPQKDFHWINRSAGQPIPRVAVVGGFENNRPLFVCHGKFNGGVHPGKVVGDTCNISWGGEERLLYNYQVLVSNYPLKWVNARNGFIPRDAIQGGRENGHPLFICQANHMGGVHTGKVVGNTCNFGYAGREVLKPFYKVLVQ